MDGVTERPFDYLVEGAERIKALHEAAVGVPLTEWTDERVQRTRAELRRTRRAAARTDARDGTATVPIHVEVVVHADGSSEGYAYSMEDFDDEIARRRKEAAHVAA